MPEETLSPNRRPMPPLKRGPKPRYYVAPSGETIVGLTRNKNGSWRVRSHLGRDITFRQCDPEKAVERFRKLQEEAGAAAEVSSELEAEREALRTATEAAVAEQQRYMSMLVELLKQSSEMHAFVGKTALLGDAATAQVGKFQSLTNRRACEIVRSLLVSDPVFVAKHLGITGKLVMSLAEQVGRANVRA